MIERLVDVAAHEIGMAPDALRRKNFITAMPTRPRPARPTIQRLRRPLGARTGGRRLNGFERRLAQSAQVRRLRGVGIATYIEPAATTVPTLRACGLDDDGGVTVLTGTQSTGQGHATAFAQIVADHLGLAPERVRMIQGDTDLIATGTGTGGSSSIPCGGASVAGAAAKLARKLKDIAADTLEAAAGDLEIADGAVRVAGTDRMVSFADLARSPKVRGRPLAADDAFTPEEATYPNGTHLAEVEIDPETGATRILRYLVVDDFGATLNPLLLAGQVHGGTVQGIGQALMENTVYDRDPG